MTRTTVLEIATDDILPTVKDTPMEEALIILIRGYEALCAIDDKYNNPAMSNSDFIWEVDDIIADYKRECNYEEEN